MKIKINLMNLAQYLNKENNLLEKIFSKILNPNHFSEQCLLILRKNNELINIDDICSMFKKQKNTNFFIYEIEFIELNKIFYDNYQNEKLKDMYNLLKLEKIIIENICSLDFINIKGLYLKKIDDILESNFYNELGKNDNQKILFNNIAIKQYEILRNEINDIVNEVKEKIKYQTSVQYFKNSIPLLNRTF